MPIDYETHNQKTGHAPQAERSGRKHLRGKVRTALADVEGQDRYECRRIRRKTWLCKNDILQLGIWDKISATRQTAGNRQSLWYFGANSDTERIISDYFRKFPQKSPKGGYPLLQYPPTGDIISHVTLGVLTSTLERARLLHPNVTFGAMAGSFRF